MARNSGGTYVLPSGNPVTSGTTITSTWANTLTGDLATEITDSLNRSGKGGMLAPLRGVDGTVAAPSLSFTNETGSGWFRESAGVVKGVILGVYRLLLNATGVSVNGTLGVSGVTTLSSNLAFSGGNQASTTASNASLTLAGNRTGADSGADVVVNSTATRTAGLLLDVQNNTSSKYQIDYNGVPALVNGLVTGEVITASNLTTTSGTPQAITNWSFAVAANGVYMAEYFVQGSGGGADSFSMSVTGPAAPTDVGYTMNSASGGLKNAAAFAGVLNGTVAVQVYTGSFMLVNGANAGTVQFNYFSSAGGGGTITFRKGAYLRWRRLA